jgi:modulator of FtsH protease HflK
VKAPAVTRERLYIETMEQVLSSTTTIFIDQKAGNNLIYLPLDKLVPMMGEAGGRCRVPPLTEADAIRAAVPPAAAAPIFAAGG